MMSALALQPLRTRSRYGSRTTDCRGSKQEAHRRTADHNVYGMYVTVSLTVLSVQMCATTCVQGRCGAMQHERCRGNVCSIDSSINLYARTPPVLQGADGVQHSHGVENSIDGHASVIRDTAVLLGN